MHHLENLQRKRTLNFYLLTPEEVVPPIDRSFVVTKHKYSSLEAGKGFNPVVPRRKTSANLSRRPTSVTQRKKAFSEGCPTCGENHTPVAFFGHKHVCGKCIRYLRSPTNKPAKIIQDEQGNIHSISYDEDKNHVEIDPNDLRIFDIKCYATFADEGQVIVLLRDSSVQY